MTLKEQVFSILDNEAIRLNKLKLEVSRIYSANDKPEKAQAVPNDASFWRYQPTIKTPA